MSGNRGLQAPRYATIIAYMPVFAHLFPEQKILVSQFKGRLTGELLTSYYEKIISLDDGSTEYAELVDFRSVTEIDIESDTLSNVANKITSLYGASETKMKCAVIAGSDLAYGLSRMYEMGESPETIEIGVFRDLPEALDWLGASDLAFQKQLDRLSSDSPSVVLKIG